MLIYKRRILKNIKAMLNLNILVYLYDLSYAYFIKCKNNFKLRIPRVSQTHFAVQLRTFHPLGTLIHHIP